MAKKKNSDNHDKMTETLRVRVPAELKVEVSKKANELNLDISDLIRISLRNWFKKPVL